MCSARVAVAMSGGVDSSVAAALLLEQGAEVMGVTMRLAQGDEDEGAIESAREVCLLLGVEHHVIDLREPFQEKVLRHCWLEYDRGRTPNPCVLCNRAVKVGALLSWAREVCGAARLATGHHARVEDGNILRGVDRRKDQAYFLCALSEEQARSLVLPIGGMTKAQVREVATGLSLPCAEQPDSQDVCPAARGEEGELFAEGLRRRFGGRRRPGEVVDGHGEVVGRHSGVHQFTVGQRRGLGVPLGRRSYVTAIDGEGSRIYLSAEPADLLAGGLEATLFRQSTWRSARRCEAQIRYRHEATPALVEPHPDEERRVVVRFVDGPERAVTPGQVVALFEGDRLLGGGWIDSALKSTEKKRTR